MRKLLVALMLAFSLAACGTGGALNVNKPVPAEVVQTPVQIAQAGVRQGYAVHAAVTTTIGQNYTDKVITKETKDKYAAILKTALGYIDTADGLAGTNPNAANAQLALANALITQLQQELAKLAAKGNQ